MHKTSLYPGILSSFISPCALILASLSAFMCSLLQFPDDLTPYAFIYSFHHTLLYHLYGTSIIHHVRFVSTYKVLLKRFLICFTTQHSAPQSGFILASCFCCLGFSGELIVLWSLILWSYKYWKKIDLESSCKSYSFK